VGRWTPEEDEKLQKLIEGNAHYNYKNMEKKVGGL